ncbi:MAG: cupredoxin domain-containing protein [Acidimicrobiales bacterium]
MTPLRSLAIAAVLAVGLGACGGSGGSGGANETSSSADAGDDTAVAIKTFMFDPDPVEVKAGTTITWTNEDEILHTITAGKRTYHEDGISKGQAKSIDKSGLFDADLDDVGATFSFTFDKAGTFDYLCTIHPGMDGSIVVS